jgi:hypothetical protein
MKTLPQSLRRGQFLWLCIKNMARARQSEATAASALLVAAVFCIPMRRVWTMPHYRSGHKMHRHHTPSPDKGHLLRCSPRNVTITPITFCVDHAYPAFASPMNAKSPWPAPVST